MRRSFLLSATLSKPSPVDPVSVGPPSVRVHLRAALLVLGLLLLVVAVGRVFTSRLEKRYIHAVALEGSAHKDRSIVWQRAAVAEPDILPIYGSSELWKHFGNEPQRFFASYP